MYWLLVQLVSLQPACPTGGANPPQVPSEAAVLTAARVAAASPALARLWPGYWPSDQAFIIYTKGHGALLISQERPSGAFRSLEGAGLPSSLQGKAYFHPGDLSGVEAPFVLDFPIGNERTAILVSEEQVPAVTIDMLLHEQFHDYQFTAFQRGRWTEFLEPDGVRDRLSFAATAETERILLIAALAANSKEEERAVLRQYLALRRERQKEMSDAAISTERGFERIEGTAEYVATLGGTIMSGGGHPALEASLILGLQKDLKNSESFAQNWFRWRSYGVGATLSYLLDKGGNRRWRDRLARGAPLDELLAQAVGYHAASDSPALANSARERFGYDMHRSLLEPLIRVESEITTEEQFYALATYRVLFEFNAPVVDGKLDVTETFKGDIVQLSPKQMALPRPDVVSVVTPSAALTVRGRPYMSESDRLRQFRTALLKSAPTVNGEVLPMGKHRLDRAEIRAEGYELAVRAPLIVEVGENQMLIRLLDTPSDAQ